MVFDVRNDHRSMPPPADLSVLPGSLLARSEEAPCQAPMRFGVFPVTETHSFPPVSADSCWIYVTLNAEIALSLPDNPGLASLVGSSRLRLSVDGQWLWWALRRKYPSQSLVKLSGSDLIYQIARHCAAHGQRLLLLGSRPAINAKAVEALASHAPGLDVVGAEMPFYADRDDMLAHAHDVALGIVRSCRPDYVVLGLGAHKEHRLAQVVAHRLDGSVKGLLCFGGAIDIAGGAYRRAPKALQRAGLEGLFRVAQDPARALRLLRVLRVLPRLAAGRY